MKFETRHEFDAPLDAIELAIMSPELAAMLLASAEGFESIEVRSHEVDDGEFRRVWRFRAQAPLKILRGYDITREMLTWDEHSVYTRATHTAEWFIVPQGDESPDASWRKHFSAGGSYRLDPLSDGRTRRTVMGEMVIGLKLVGPMIERVALRDVRKAYDAEADAIRKLADLG